GDSERISVCLETLDERSESPALVEQSGCLNFCKKTQKLRQIKPFAVRLAQATPSGTRPCLEGKSFTAYQVACTFLYFPRLFVFHYEQISFVLTFFRMLLIVRLEFLHEVLEGFTRLIRNRIVS